MKQNYPVGVLVLEQSKDAAEALVNSLRRSGFSLRPRWVNRPGMLAEFLRGQRWDLLFAGLETPVIPPAQVIDIVSRSESDLAIIGVCAKSENDQLIEDTLRAGFHEVVSLEREFLLKHIVTREIESLSQRRLADKFKTGLKASARTLRELIHNSEQALAVVHSGQILQANPAWLELMKIPTGEDPRGRSFSEYVAEEDREEFSRMISEQSQEPDLMVEIELTGKRADDERIPLSLSIASGTLEERVGLLITARGPATLTPDDSAPEPHAFIDDRFDSLVQAIDADRKSNAGGALACIMIENQQKLDEVLGLAGHKKLAMEIVERTRNQKVPDAVVARVSDDTIGIYLSRVGLDDMRGKADQIAKAISRDVVTIDEHAIRPACLTGVAAVSEEHAGGMDVLEAAYAACRRPEIARSEANRPASNANFPQVEEIAADLVNAMTDGRLSLVFQPIVRLHGEPIELYEVFIRLNDRQGLAVPTDVVISAAQQADISVQLDLWVIRKSIEIIESRRNQGHDSHLFVKLSDQCVGDITIPLTISRELKAHRVPPKNLIVELSEATASGNLKRSRAFVESLQKIGSPAALEHFGLSLRAFQLLEDVPAAYLKLDASLINRLAEDVEAYNQVAEICARARELEKHTIASYLDNPRSLSKLYEAGIEFAQGYYIQEPSETMDFEFSILVE